jgi:hypothetical protein
MEKYSLLFLVLVVISIIACSPSKRTSSFEEELNNSRNSASQLDSILSNYSDTPEECIKVLSLASRTKDYLPGGRLFYTLDYLQYADKKYGDILKCVAEQAGEGNLEAERVLITYFQRYYDDILSIGYYNDPQPFWYLGYTRSSEAIKFMYQMAQDRSERVVNGHGPMLGTPPIYGIAQASILYRVKINNQFPKIDFFPAEYCKPRIQGSQCDKVDRWKEELLPFLTEAENNGTLTYATFGEELNTIFPYYWFF